MTQHCYIIKSQPKIYFIYVNLDLFVKNNKHNINIYNCIFKYIDLLNTYMLLINDYNLVVLIASKVVILHILNSYALSSVLVVS